MSVVITDLGSDVQFAFTGQIASEKFIFNKSTMRVKQGAALVYVTNSDSFNQGKDNKVLELVYTSVTSPVYASNDALFEALKVMIDDNASSVDDRGYDEPLDADKVVLLNPEYGHNTSVELLVSESNLGLDGVHDGGASTTVFTDTGETYTAAQVAEGFLIYNVTDSASALINSGGAGNPTADDITHAALSGANAWAATEVASIPEVKRFVIPVTDFKKLKIHYEITAGAANKCYMKIYETLDSAADDSDVTNWVNRSVDHLTGKDGFSTDHVEATASSTIEDIFEVDCLAGLKYMIEVVAECTDGVQSNSFDVKIKKA
jgi:hypothetical protein